MSAVPKLRFPEFDGDWEESIGAEIAEKITKGSSPRWQGFDYQDEGILFVTSENVRDGYLDISKPKFLPEAFMKRASGAKLKKNDILINIVGASIGRSCVYTNENIATVNQAVAIFRVNKKNNYQFISYYYQNGDAQKTVQSVQSESARPNISLTDLRNLSFVVPSLPEQQKIASFLSAVDKKIDLLRQKKDGLELYKKGLMQKIFSQEIRFKQDDGSDFPDWEGVAFGDVVEINSDKRKTPSKFRYIDLESVKGGVLTNPQEISSDDAPSRAQRVLMRGDILFQLVRPYQMNNLFFDYDGRFVASTGYAQLRNV